MLLLSSCLLAAAPAVAKPVPVPAALSVLVLAVVVRKTLGTSVKNGEKRGKHKFNGFENVEKNNCTIAKTATNRKIEVA